MDTNTLVLSLISGLLGAILGSIISGIATFYITRYSLSETTKNSLLISQHDRSADKKQYLDNAKLSLITELIENADLIILNKTVRSKFRFTTDAWSIYKQFITTLPGETGKLLLFAYAEIKRYNTLIDYDVNITPGLGLLDSQIETQEYKVQQAIDKAKESLESELKVSK